jgi:hypothetical protein
MAAMLEIATKLGFPKDTSRLKIVAMEMSVKNG